MDTKDTKKIKVKSYFVSSVSFVVVRPSNKVDATESSAKAYSM